MTSHLSAIEQAKDLLSSSSSFFLITFPKEITSNTLPCTIYSIPDSPLTYSAMLGAISTNYLQAQHFYIQHYTQLQTSQQEEYKVQMN